MTASRKVLGAAAWTASAAALLAVGFLFWVNLGSSIALVRAKPEAGFQVRTAFEVYARVVLLKGLLPALLLALALWPLLDWRGRFSRRGRLGFALGLALAATLASVAVAAAFLPVPALGLPAVKYTGTVNFLLTCIEMAGAVTLAAWIPRSVRPRSAALIVAGLVVVFLAGGASMTYWAQTRAPHATPNAAPPPPVPDAAVPLPAPAAPSEVALPLEPDRVSQSDPAPLVGGPDAEEIARRREMAARLRKLIAEGKDALEPPTGGGLLAEGVPSPVYENGELLGVELQNLRPDGFYARLGLRDGDLVQSINGVGLQSIDDMALDASGKLLEEFVRSPNIELQVERSDGTQGVIAVPREQIVQGLMQLDELFR